jgi:hypothetical protein
MKFRPAASKWSTIRVRTKSPHGIPTSIFSLVPHFSHPMSSVDPSFIEFMSSNAWPPIIFSGPTLTHPWLIPYLSKFTSSTVCNNFKLYIRQIFYSLYNIRAASKIFCSLYNIRAASKFTLSILNDWDWLNWLQIQYYIGYDSSLSKIIRSINFVPI